MNQSLDSYQIFMDTYLCPPPTLKEGWGRFILFLVQVLPFPMVCVCACVRGWHGSQRETGDCILPNNCDIEKNWLDLGALALFFKITAVEKLKIHSVCVWGGGGGAEGGEVQGGGGGGASVFSENTVLVLP